MTQRERRGLREFSAATDGRGPAATDRVREASPILAEGVERFIFSDVFAEAGLSARERELITVAVLAALGGADNQLGVHVPAALACGADPDELVRLCEQITPYAGFPRALNALRAVRAVLEEQGLPLPIPAREIELGDHSTRVIDTGGEGVPLLLIHPPELDRYAWRATINGLDGRRRVIAPDLRGAGSAADAPPAESVAHLVEDIIATVTALDVDQVDLVSAAGSGLAAQLNLTRPSLIRDVTIVMTDTGARPDPPSVDALAAWFSAKELAEDSWEVRYARDRLRRRDPASWPALSAIIEIDEPDTGAFEGRQFRVVRLGPMPLLTNPTGLISELSA